MHHTTRGKEKVGLDLPLSIHFQVYYIHLINRNLVFLASMAVTSESLFQGCQPGILVRSQKGGKLGQGNLLSLEAAKSAHKISCGGRACMSSDVVIGSGSLLSSWPCHKKFPLVL